MSRGRTLLCAGVLGLSAVTLGCKSEEKKDPNAAAAAAFVSRYCDLYQPCCVAAGLPGDGKACRDLFEGSMSPQAQYNATAGDSCLSGLMAISTQPGFCEGDLVQPSACVQAFGGITGACIQDTDCPAASAGDARCVSSVMNGKETRKCQVQVRGQAGSTPCVGSVRAGVTLYAGTTGDVPDQGFLCSSDDGLRCDGTACVALTADGAACELGSDCVVPDFCDVTTGTCAARKPIGSACIGQALECADGSFCDEAAMTCAAQRADGAACTDNTQCVSQNCDANGVCAPTPTVGPNALCGG